MLYVCSSIKKYQVFHEKFQEMHDTVIDLSKVPSADLANECDSIASHHTDCAVFMGYLEPGWMIEPSHQTRIRKLIRKFNVGLVCYFPESLPFSWKTDIHTFYTENPNGGSDSVNNGSSLQDQSDV